MLEHCKSAKERWGGVSEIIDRWLQERQELLVQFCQLTANPQAEAAPAKLQAMCQILVDYVSAGHFEVYDQLIREGEEFDDEEALNQAEDLFKQIDSTTEIVLDFNDKYLETDDLDALPADLSAIGEALESRFAAEDHMIGVLHIAHKDLVT